GARDDRCHGARPRPARGARDQRLRLLKRTVSTRYRSMARQGRHVHDDRLGYAPRPGYVGPGLTIDGDALRATGACPADATSIPPILAVGDSYTFGDDVTDLQSWPAQLQRLTGRRVLNGGVSGYGFDQIVLRAEQLAAVHKPAVIVVSCI